MTKKILSLLLILLTIVVAPAQNKKGHHSFNTKMAKEVRDFKIKFLAQEMDLDESQATKFAELYTNMCDEKRAVFKEVRSLQKKIKDNKAATDRDYEIVSQAITNAKLKDAEIDKKYDEKFATFLSKKQIFKMKEAEEQFRKKMMDMRRKKK